MTLNSLENLALNTNGKGKALLSQADNKIRSCDKFLEIEIREIMSWFMIDYYYTGTRSTSPLSWKSLKDLRALIPILCRERKNIRVEDYVIEDVLPL